MPPRRGAAMCYRTLALETTTSSAALAAPPALGADKVSLPGCRLAQGPERQWSPSGSRQ